MMSGKNLIFDQTCAHVNGETAIMEARTSISLSYICMYIVQLGQSQSVNTKIGLHTTNFLTKSRQHRGLGLTVKP